MRQTKKGNWLPALCTQDMLCFQTTWWNRPAQKPATAQQAGLQGDDYP